MNITAVSSDALGSEFAAQLEEARRTFKERVVLSSDEYGSLMCSIHAAYEPPGQHGHNCIGCNFDDLTWQLSDFLDAAVHMSDTHHVFFIYVLIANGIWERMRDIFNIVGVPESYREQHFKPFYRVRRWSNFFKHPKSFTWLIHHPTFTTADSLTHRELIVKGECLFIDDNFVKDHYISVGCKSPDEKYENHRESTVVVLPSIQKLTTSLCYSLEHFVDLVTKNPVYVSMLSDKATILHHYNQVRSDSEDKS